MYVYIGERERIRVKIHTPSSNAIVAIANEKTQKGERGLAAATFAANSYCDIQKGHTYLHMPIQ